MRRVARSLPRPPLPARARASCLVALGALLVLAVPARGQRVEAEELILDNGMTFLLVPRDEEPNTISCGWVAKVGSVNERPGITGISHFFEHMMFKGTTTIGTTDAAADADFMARQRDVKTRLNELVWTGQYARSLRGEIDDPWDPAHDTEEIRLLRADLRELMERHRDVIVKNEFDRIYTKNGASGMNAFTSHDMTFYFINVPSNKLELWTWMESDRLHDSVFREFYAERDVVHEERRMRLESSPTGALEEQFDAMFWQASPYSWSVIGWPSDLNSYTREQFDDFYAMYYQPANLVGVIVGDFDPAEARRLVTSYFGRLEPGPRPPAPVVTLEVEQLGEKRMTGTCDCQPQVEVRYHTVPFGHRDEDPLRILAEILNGRTGRLYKSMIEGAGIATTVGARQESRRYAGLFAFAGEVRGDATPADLEAAWEAELERLRAEPVSDLELAKVKNQVAADSYRRLGSNGALLFQLGMYEAMGGWEYLNESPARLMTVTADDVARVVAAYFTPENRNVCTFLRRPREDGSGAAAADALAAFPPEVRENVEAMLAQILPRENPDELRQIVGMLEMQRAQVPEEFRPAMEYVLRRVRERIAVLETAGAEGGDR